MLEVVEPCLLHALQVFARMGLGIIFAPRKYECYGDKEISYEEGNKSK